MTCRGRGRDYTYFPGGELLEVTYEPVEETGVEKEVIRQTFDDMVHDLSNVLDPYLIVEAQNSLRMVGVARFAKDGVIKVTIRREK